MPHVTFFFLIVPSLVKKRMTSEVELRYRQARVVGVDGSGKARSTGWSIVTEERGDEKDFLEGERACEEDLLDEGSMMRPSDSVSRATWEKSKSAAS